MLWHILDIFFIIFHTALILFNLSGWIWRKTRLLNLLTLLLTGASWSLLGIIVGTPGYCPLTDWHFSVLDKLGRTGIPDSYIKYLADRLTGLNFSSSLIDCITLIAFIAALVASLLMNLRDFRTRKAAGNEKVRRKE